MRLWSLHPAEVLIQRFLFHLLPPGFVRIRHYGLLANRCKARPCGSVGKPWDNRLIHRFPNPKHGAVDAAVDGNRHYLLSSVWGHQPLLRTPLPVAGGMVMTRAP